MDWIKCKLGNLIIEQRIKITPPFKPDIHYVGLEHLHSGGGLKSKGKVIGLKSSKTYFEKEDILYGKLRPYLNKHWIADSFGVCSTDILVYKSNPGVLNSFINYYFGTSEFISRSNTESSGINLPRISSKKIQEFDFNLPPFEEQQRIVAKLDKLFAHLEETKTRLNKIPQLLKNFRQSVLTQAVTGNIELDKVIHWNNKKLGELFQVKTGATPKRGEKKYYEDGKIPWLKSGQVKNELIFQAEEFITDLAVKETNAKLYPADSILVAMYGEGKTRGQVGWTKIEAASNQAIAALTNEDMHLITKEFVYNFCLSQYLEIRKQAEGGNQPNLNLSKIKNWEVNLPKSIENQELINQYISSSLTKVDKIEEMYQNLKERLDNLPQSILAKAFRGELVEQLPTDGDAQELLNEIQKLKAQTTKKKK